MAQKRCAMLCCDVCVLLACLLLNRVLVSTNTVITVRYWCRNFNEDGFHCAKDVVDK